MRKPGYSSKPPGKGGSHSRGNQSRGNTSRSNQSRGPKSPARTQNRGKSQGSHREAVRLWMTSSSQTLTSHIGMVNKRKNGNAAKRGEAKNGAGPTQHKNKGKPRHSHHRSRQESTSENGSPQRSTGHSKPGRGQSVKETAGPRVSQTPAPGPAKGTLKLVANIDPFELFCAYHLGIGTKNDYKPANINEVANRFNVDPATIRQAVKNYGMDSGSLLDRDFDLALAQLDIQVAPEGINRTELGRTIYEEFVNSPVKKRDWKKILEEDRKENMKIFGNR